LTCYCYTSKFLTLTVSRFHYCNCCKCCTFVTSVLSVAFAKCHI
jgi:hypothetical protein